MELTSDIPDTLRNADDISRLIREGYAGLDASTDVRPSLDCLYALAANNRPLPWPGFVFDLCEILSGREVVRLRNPTQIPEILHLLRRYEDQVLGKLHADPLLDRMTDAVHAVGTERRTDALAFAIDQVRDRLKLPSIIVSAGVMRGELDRLVRERPMSMGEADSVEGLSPFGTHLLKSLVDRVRMADSFFRIEDVLALEQGTALLPFAQSIAHRQILEASRHFQECAKVPLRRGTPDRRIASKLTDEDRYPIGGYSSIATKGAIESLLHSQLAYMDPPGADRPDFFDVKYLRDELFYYARDENEFHRRRRSFWFVLHPSLRIARQMDGGATAQRIMIALGVVDALIQQLTDRLNRESLHFHLVFLNEGQPRELQPERELLQILLRDGIQRGDIIFENRTLADCLAILERSSKTIATDVLYLAGEDNPAFEERLIVGDAMPQFIPVTRESDLECLARWGEIYGTILSNWLE